MFYSNAMRNKTKEENPEATFGDIGKLIGAAWKEVTGEERAVYEKMADEDKERYVKECEEMGIEVGGKKSETSTKEKKVREGAASLAHTHNAQNAHSTSSQLWLSSSLSLSHSQHTTPLTNSNTQAESSEGEATKRHQQGWGKSASKGSAPASRGPLKPPKAARTAYVFYKKDRLMDFAQEVSKQPASMCSRTLYEASTHRSPLLTTHLYSPLHHPPFPPPAP